MHFLKIPFSLKPMLTNLEQKCELGGVADLTEAGGQKGALCHDNTNKLIDFPLSSYLDKIFHGPQPLPITPIAMFLLTRLLSLCDLKMILNPAPF